MGPQQLTVSPTLSFVVTPAAASPLVTAYAKRLANDIFAHGAGPTPPGSLATVNINVVNPNVPLQLGVDEVSVAGASGREQE